MLNASGFGRNFAQGTTSQLKAPAPCLEKRRQMTSGLKIVAVPHFHHGLDPEALQAVCERHRRRHSCAICFFRSLQWGIPKPLFSVQIVSMSLFRHSVITMPPLRNCIRPCTFSWCMPAWRRGIVLLFSCE